MFLLIGRCKEIGVRKFVTPRYAYLIYGTIDAAEDEIIVLAVKHSAQEGNLAIFRASDPKVGTGFWGKSDAQTKC
jgi:hypothetical protein